MRLHDVHVGVARRDRRVRKGRGRGSGFGRTAGRGNKGQRSRSGGSTRPTFEGGQMPLFRRIPKRGFNNANFTKRYAIVNVGSLGAFAQGDVVDFEAARAKGLVKKRLSGLKVLGRGELQVGLTVRAAAVSASAREKIERAKGQVELV